MYFALQSGSITAARLNDIKPVECVSPAIFSLFTAVLRSGLELHGFNCIVFHCVADYHKGIKMWITYCKILALIFVTLNNTVYLCFIINN